MYTANSQKRVQEILDFITEITLGNYTYTLPLRNQKDELEQIVLSLNTMVEEIDTTVHKINHEKSNEVIQNIVFNLNRNLYICSYSENVHEILQYSKEELINTPVKLITAEKTALPDEITNLFELSSDGNLPFKIEFKHHNGCLWSGYGYLHQLVTNSDLTYTLSVFKSVHSNEYSKNLVIDQNSGNISYPSEYRSLLLQDQRKLKRKLHKYIMKRLDRKLKTLSVIASEVGGSTSKIKLVFKNAYDETIYTYHLRKRLEKASVLIMETNLPINEIAEECGFKSFSHFSRSFKKAFGYTPSQFRKS